MALLRNAQAPEYSNDLSLFFSLLWISWVFLMGLLVNEHMIPPGLDCAVAYRNIAVTLTDIEHKFMNVHAFTGHELNVAIAR